MPRPSFRPTDEQRKQVKLLSALGHRHEDICAMLNLKSPKTLRKHFRKELSAGMAEANARVAQIAYEMAASGRFPAMTFFYLKCHARPAERVEEEEPKKNWSVEIRFPGQAHVPAHQTGGTHGQA